MIKEVCFLSETDQQVLKACQALKISVSGVKFSRGHDGDCMEANLKVGSRIKGAVWDDSYGGGFQYQGDDVNEFLTIADEIAEAAPKITKFSTPMAYDRDIVVDVLVKDFLDRKDCKKKTMLLARKGEDERLVVERFEVKGTYDPSYNSRWIKEFDDDGYAQVEIVNKRYA